MRDLESNNSARQARFNTTHWSLVREAAGFLDSGAGRALEKLCTGYWFPLYAFVRRQGYASADAEDLTQGFFSWLIESKHLGAADPQIGRFRSFLLCRLKHFLSDENKKARAQKRGGGQFVLSFDLILAEEWYGLELSTELSPDLIFDRRWALTVMERAVQRLRREYYEADRGALYDQLKHFQPGEERGVRYDEVAAQLGLTPGAVKSAIYRFRQRYGELLREEIAQTVSTAAEVDGEIRYLLSIVG